MHPITSARNLAKLNERELALGNTGNERKSWHQKYRDSAWIFVGGLPYELTEGDVVCIFSQYGEIVNINLLRDHKTGKSRGFGFICYEDQRSTILAVDNFNTAKVLGRILRVDHVEEYKVPKLKDHIDEEVKKLWEEGVAPKPVIDIKKEEDSSFLSPPTFEGKSLKTDATVEAEALNSRSSKQKDKESSRQRPPSRDDNIKEGSRRHKKKKRHHRHDSSEEEEASVSDESNSRKRTSAKRSKDESRVASRQKQDDRGRERKTEASKQSDPRIGKDKGEYARPVTRDDHESERLNAYRRDYSSDPRSSAKGDSSKAPQRQRGVVDNSASASVPKRSTQRSEDVYVPMRYK